jgi:hypothetical protein
MQESKRRWIFFAATVLVLSSCLYWRSDARRLSLFHAHKSDYQTPLTMLQHDDGLTFINSALTVPDDPTSKGISRQRITEYRRYMSSIECDAILYEPSMGSALFVSETAGTPNILYFPASAAGYATRESGGPRHPSQPPICSATAHGGAKARSRLSTRCCPPTSPRKQTRFAP